MILCRIFVFVLSVSLPILASGLRSPVSLLKASNCYTTGCIDSVNGGGMFSIWGTSNVKADSQTGGACGAGAQIPYLNIASGVNSGMTLTTKNISTFPFSLCTVTRYTSTYQYNYYGIVSGACQNSKCQQDLSGLPYQNSTTGLGGNSAWYLDMAGTPRILAALQIMVVELDRQAWAGVAVFFQEFRVPEALGP